MKFINTVYNNNKYIESERAAGTRGSIKQQQVAANALARSSASIRG